MDLSPLIKVIGKRRVRKVNANIQAFLFLFNAIKYPVVIASWQNNLHKLSTFLKYSESIRRLIYTTNAIECFHRQVRKVTKNKNIFTSDMVLLKLIYPAKRNSSKKWTSPLQFNLHPQ